MSENNRNSHALLMLTTLFFMWGFITCLNDILIPYLKKIFELNYFRAMLVQLSFFGAYFIGSLIYLIVSFWKDPIRMIGYKNSIIIGLSVSAIACFMFYPASYLHSYPLFLGSLFVLGLGFTLLQITANPFVAILGPQKSASSRLNMAQGFNSLGTTIAPIIGGYLIFHYFNKWGSPILNSFGEPILMSDGNALTAASVQMPYAFFALIFIALAIVFFFTKLPDIDSDSDKTSGFGVLKYRHLLLGMIAIFMYVGSEVSVGSMIINYLGETMKMPEIQAKSFLAFYWGGAMIGRFSGAISLNDTYSQQKKLFLMTVLSFITFALIIGIVFLESGASFQQFLPFMIFMVLNLFMFFIAKSSPSKTLMLFAITAIGLLIVAMLFQFPWTMWCIISLGLFNSIMWSNIFTLAIKDLGKYTAQGSSILIMAILGGALLPPLQGLLADSIGVTYSFVIPVIGYMYLVFYGAKGYKVNLKNS